MGAAGVFRGLPLMVFGLQLGLRDYDIQSEGINHQLCNIKTERNVYILTDSLDHDYVHQEFVF